MRDIFAAKLMIIIEYHSIVTCSMFIRVSLENLSYFCLPAITKFQYDHFEKCYWFHTWIHQYAHNSFRFLIAIPLTNVGIEMPLCITALFDVFFGTNLQKCHDVTKLRHSLAI